MTDTISPRIASEMAGCLDYRDCTQSDHDITPAERSLAIEIGHEIAARCGIDLDAHVTAQRARLQQLEADHA
jgi:hypothetical protein